MGKSNITYLDWNITCVEGCTPISAGCANCYAQEYLTRFKKPTGIVLHPERLEKDMKSLARIKERQVVGIAFTGDLFHDDVPFEFIGRVLFEAKQCPQHTFLFLTKRPARMDEFFDWCGHQGFGVDTPLITNNLWLGVSVEDQNTLEERWFRMSRIPAAKKWISLEPLLEDVEFHGGVVDSCAPDWVVLGCESGKNRRPFDEDWVRHVRDQLAYGGVPFMYKQGSRDGKLVHLPELDGVVHDGGPG